MTKHKLGMLNIINDALTQSKTTRHQRHAPYRMLATLCICGIMLQACSNNENNTTPSDMNTSMDMSPDLEMDQSDDMSQPDGGMDANVCQSVDVNTYYDDAGIIGECTSTKGKRIAETMLTVEGIKIDNAGEEMTPCLRVVCDENYAYVISNNIPHYDFVVLTPNPLVESLGVHRIPLNPSMPKGTNAVDISTLDGCTGMYEEYLNGNVPRDEPSGYCGDGYLTEQTSTGTKTYAQIPCLSQFAVVTSGVMINGPNEADRGVWGDVGLEPFNERAQGPGASVDFCGGHTGRSMHYHAANEACFTKDENNKPTMSYAIIGDQWDQKKLIDGECAEPSGIIGWSFDGYPIKGPCICVERGNNGSCTTVKRARSPWLYKGIKSHTLTTIDALENLEGKACEDKSDCCDADDPRCDFACNYVVAPGENAGSEVTKICTFLRHSWCTREHTNMEGQNTSAQDFVYLDTCNGYDGADGFAYHAIVTFPYVQACYRGEPAEQASAGMGMMPGGPGGMMPGRM